MDSGSSSSLFLRSKFCHSRIGWHQAERRAWPWTDISTSEGWAIISTTGFSQRCRRRRSQLSLTLKLWDTRIVEKTAFLNSLRLMKPRLQTMKARHQSDVLFHTTAMLLINNFGVWMISGIISRMIILPTPCRFVYP
jgi:hypothetical protein